MKYVMVILVVSIISIIGFQLYVGSNTIIADSVYRSQVIQFDIIHEENEIADVRVYRGSGGRQPMGIWQAENLIHKMENMYSFETGQLAGGEKIVFGERVEFIDPKDYKVVSIEWVGIGKRSFSIKDFEGLPSEVRVNQGEVYLLDRDRFIELMKVND